MTRDEEDRIVGSMVRERTDLARRAACLEHGIDSAHAQISEALRALERFSDDDSCEVLPCVSYPDADYVLAQVEALCEVSQRRRALGDRLASC